MEQEDKQHRTNFIMTSIWNQVAGNAIGESKVDPKDISFKLIEEEFKEVAEAYEEGSLEHLSKELADLLVVVYGAFYRLGLNADLIFALVTESNFSKFCKTEEEAQETVDYYNDKEHNGFAYLEKTQGLYVVKRTEDGKVLKSLGYFKPNLSAIAGLQNESSTSGTNKD